MDNEDLSHHYELLLLLSLSEASDRVLTLKSLIPIEIVDEDRIVKSFWLVYFTYITFATKLYTQCLIVLFVPLFATKPSNKLDGF